MNIKITILLLALGTALISEVVQARVKCAQFKTHQEAQRYFETKKRGYKSLDRDKDGLACECNRGGPSSNKNACKRWRKKNKV